MSMIVDAPRKRVELSTGELIEYVSCHGTDRTIAEAAWVSSDRANGRTDEDVVKLVRYLAKHDHWTPLAHASMTMRFRVPIFTARQLMRSNVGIVWNEESRRYVDNPPSFWGTSHPPVWRGRGENIKQGSGDALGRQDAWDVDVAYRTAINTAWESYQKMLAAGCCPEQARSVLPVGTFTNLVGSFTLPALARVVGLRVDKHAQLEIRLVAQAVDLVVGMVGWCTEAWRAVRSKP